MNRTMRWMSLWVLAAVVAASGCSMDTHADRGALFGGLLGAGTGAVIGDAAGNPGAGAAIGAGVGALSGAALGAGQDEIEAKRQRQAALNAVTINDVVTMTHAHVNDDVIINHIRSHGMVALPTSNDLIALQQSGVSPRVVEAMQQSPPPRTQTVIVRETSPPPVVIGGYYGRPHPPRHRCHVWW